MSFPWQPFLFALSMRKSPMKLNSIIPEINMPFKFKILSIDGGGIRGIIPAIILAEIEKRTKKPICELFDLVAGTSTGGILALGLAKPDPKKPKEAHDSAKEPHYSAKDLIDLYRQEGKYIFREPFIERWMDTDDLIRPKYPSEGRDKVLSNYFGDTPLKDALTEVFITSYDVELRAPVFFTSKQEKKVTDSLVFRKICNGFTMKQAAMATSAAPTYFQPYQIPTAHRTEKGFYSLIDGGVFANNPASLALMEAIIDSKKAAQEHPEKEELRLEDVLVVSLGTGSLTRRYPYEQAKNWGLLGWVQPLINITLDGSSEAVAVQLEQLLPRADKKPPQYYRFQQFLNSANDNIDDASEKNIKNLEVLANLIIEERTDDLDELCRQLLAKPEADKVETRTVQYLAIS